MHFLVFTPLDTAVPTVAIHIFSCVYQFCHSRRNESDSHCPTRALKLQIISQLPSTDRCQIRPGGSDMVMTPLEELEAKRSSYMRVKYCAGPTCDHTPDISPFILSDPTENRQTATSRCSTGYIALDPEATTLCNRPIRPSEDQLVEGGLVVVEQSTVYRGASLHTFYCVCVFLR